MKKSRAFKAYRGLGIAVMLLASSMTHAGVSLTAKASTLGLGAELVVPVSDHFNARLGYNGFNYQQTLSDTDVTYDADITLKTISAIADYHPWAGMFRLSGGVMSNGNKFSLKGVPAAATFTFNGVSYTTTDVGSVTAAIDFNSVAGYAGMGFGNAPSGKHFLSLTFDVGAMYQGTPNATLNATCGAVVIASGTCSTLQADVAAEEVTLRNDIDSFKWWPVLALGVSFRF